MVSLKTKLAVFVIAVIPLLVATVFGTSAFTATTLDRSSDITVSTDDTALLALTDGHPGRGLIEQTKKGQLTIDFTRGGADGATRNAKFVLGSETNPTAEPAFTVVNLGTQPRDVTFQYTLAGTDSGADENVKFELYRTDTSNPLSTSEQSQPATVDALAPGEEINVIIIITTGNSGGDLTGNLNVTAGG